MGPDHPFGGRGGNRSCGSTWAWTGGGFTGPPTKWAVCQGCLYMQAVKEGNISEVETIRKRYNLEN